MRGRSIGQLFTPGDRAAGRPEREMRAALDHGRAEREGWHMRADGSRLWASGELMPLRDEAGLTSAT